MTNSIWACPPSVLCPSSKPVRLSWSATLQDSEHPAIGGASIRDRRIVLHPALRRDKSECRRIWIHELFHFAWVRLGNPKRSEWKTLLQTELEANARGGLGWSSERRRKSLPGGFAAYACEAFCDTAAWLYADIGAHEEFTLGRRWRERRATWFQANAPFRY